MDAGFVQRRAAVSALVRAVFDRFVSGEDRPRFGRKPDNARWWRQGQEEFIGLQCDAWHMPDDLPIYGWLDRFPEMAAVREAYAADPVLGSRVDTMMGNPWSRSGTDFYWILAQHVIEPLVTKTRSYHLDEAVFDQIYRSFEGRFRADHLHMIEFRPLNAFESSMDVVPLPDGLALRRMTDRQMSEAINVLAVPRMVGGAGVNTARVSRFDQWALMKVMEFPVVGGETVAVPPQPPAFPILDEPAAFLVPALRLVCGGSVVTTRSMYAQAEDEFPFVPSGQAMLNGFDGADNNRPTILHPDAVNSIYAVFTALGLPEIRADGSLQVAIRRLIYAGSKSLAEDRLTDLMTSAEALFIKRANLTGHSKKDKIANEAATLLAGDPVLATDAAHLREFLVIAYNARNAVVHGDDEPYGPLRLLSGHHTASIAQIVDDLERIMRRAVLTVIAQRTSAAAT